AASLAGGNTINPSTGTVTYVAGWSGSSTITATIPSSATVSGCSGTKTATHTATTTPNNTITLTSGAGSNVQTSCINSAITPVTYTTTGASGATFSGLPSGVTGTWASNTATVSGTPTVSGTFSYSVTLTGGCGTASASGTITVNGLVSPGVSISASATTVCAGSPATFTASPTNGGSSPSYQWKKNGVNVATGSTYTYNPYNGDVITCLMTSNAPCASPATASSNPVTMTVNSVSIATPPVAIEYSNESLTVVGGELAGIGHWAWYDNYKGPARTEQADKINPNPGRSVRYRARAEWDSPQDGSTHSYFVSQKVQKKGESITLPADKNYVVTYSPVVETTSEADLNDQYLEDQGAVVQYFDGLGRPTQSVAVNQSWYFNDLVSGVGYDSFGRQDKTYLPATNHGLGAYVPDEPAFITGFYNNAPRTEVDGLPALTKDNENKERIATQTAYEPSPLNRVTSVSDPAGGVTTYIYGTNTTDEVINFSVEGENCVNKGTYTDNKLYLTQTIDPSGKTVKEYKDKMGKVLLKVAGDAKTYYVYDDFDLLRYVLSPEASAKMNTTGSYTPDHEIIKGLCYYYEYDGRRRMVKKQLPGADPVLMVYDTRDRLVMTQDGKTRAEDPGKWLYTKYEQFNRPVETGWLTTTFDFESLKANFENTIEFSGCDFGEVLTQTLYDSYPNAGLCTLTGRNDAVKGQVTFQKTKILDQSG
ncbi:MAG TPA: DUF6443 domain-containing protein, partial [Prolixibacteraceae bacterium]|nr:DUF6443 domain-containing protein [Prolixibacteraceae bacterium]